MASNWFVRTLCAGTIGIGVALPWHASAYCAGSDKSLPNYDPAYYSISREFRRAKFVVLGRVTRETWLGDDGKEKPLNPPFENGASRPWGLDPYAGAYYAVQVEKTFKGPPTVSLQLFSENSTARFWLTPGDQYIFFITEGSFDPPIGRKLTIDTCGNSAILEKAKAVLSALGSGLI